MFKFKTLNQNDLTLPQLTQEKIVLVNKVRHVSQDYVDSRIHSSLNKGTDNVVGSIPAIQ